MLNNRIIKIIYILCKIYDNIYYLGKSKLIPVLLYHSISGANSRLSVNPEDFELQIKCLHKNGFKTISPSDLRNKKKISKKNKYLLITFDDGFKDNYKVAKTILDKYDFKATVFISTKYVGSSSEYATQDLDKAFQIMSGEEIKYLEESGWCIANHFHSHRNLIDLTEDEIAREIDVSKEELSRIIKNSNNANIFSYPRNKVNEKVLKVMKEKKASMAFGGKRKMVDKQDNILDLPRVEIDTNVDMQKFKLYLSPSFYKLRRMLRK